MLRQPTTADHSWASFQVDALIKSMQLNMKLHSLGMWSTFIKDMGISEYREYTKMLESMMKKAA